MTLTKKKKSGPRRATLDNGISVEVRRMLEKDQVRAAAIFNPKVLDKAGVRTLRPSESIGLWKGNEAYLMFIVEKAVTLVSPMPEDDGWLRAIRRNAAAYNVNLDDLEDEDYVTAVYIRHMGMTTDEFVAAVADVAMNTKASAIETEVETKPVVEDDDDEDDDE